MRGQPNRTTAADSVYTQKSQNRQTRGGEEKATEREKERKKEKVVRRHHTFTAQQHLESLGFRIYLSTNNQRQLQLLA